jgi:diguanylate cyclase (GGDEF)-like protein/PAS domain S-box-containing protein
MNPEILPPTNDLSSESADSLRSVISGKALSRDIDNEISTLIGTLHQTSQRLEELTAGEVDAVADRQGRTFLLQHAQEQLRHSEADKQASILNALPAHVALLDSQGIIVSVNEAWRRFSASNAIAGSSYVVGLNYLENCDFVGGEGSSVAIADGIRSVLNGAAKSFSIEYACHSRTQQHWFLLIVTPLANDRPNGVIVMHVDVTSERRAEKGLRASELRFRQIAENIHDVFFLQNLDGSQIYYVSPAYEKIWGRTCESLYANPKSWADSIHPDDLHEAFTHINEFQASEFDYEFRIIRPDGGIRWIYLRGFPILDDAGKVYRMAGIASDRTQRKQALDEMLESGRRFSDLLRNVELASVMLDLEGRITYCNEYLLLLTGWTFAEVIGRSWLDVFIPPDQGDMQAVFAALLANEPAAWHHENMILTRSGERRLIRWSNSVLRSGAGDVIGTASVGEDVTERRQTEAELAHSLTHDSTTGLPRFVLLEEYLHTAFVEAAAHDGRVIVFYIDIDRFNTINETRGRAVGDQVLRSVAERLCAMIGDDGRVAHVAGDEFAIVLKDPARAQDQVEIGESIRNRIEAPIPVDHHPVYATCSIGVSCFPDNSSSPEELLRQAESGMLRAKREGRNAVVSFANEYKQELDERLSLGLKLRDALRDEQFVLHYQPRIDGQDWRVCGFEALLRWQNPELGLLPPARFLPVAEDLGIMVDIGRFVLDSACKQARDWIDGGAENFTISINVSPVQMQRSVFVDEVSMALKRWSLPAHYVELELVESMMAGNIHRVIGTMRALKSLGVTISLDDFGTGYSSLNYLRRFPIDTLKIDQSFVQDISTDAGAAGICRAIITLGHQLGMKVVAEGVETAAQVGYLRRNECDYFQGFFFGKAVSAAQALEILRRSYLPQAELEQHLDASTLLLVDDEANILQALTRVLRREGYRILTANGGDEALDVLGRNDVQVIISDQRMPGVSGTELLSKVKEMYPHTVRMVLSGYTDLAAITDAINEGAIYKFLTKPWNDEELRQQVRDAFRIAHRSPRSTKSTVNRATLSL